jgi:hypothetical protein
VQGNREWLDQSRRPKGDIGPKYVAAIFRYDRVFRVSTVARKSDGGCGGAVYEKPSTTEFAFSAGIDGVDRNPIADTKSCYGGTKFNHLAGKLVAENKGY